MASFDQWRSYTDEAIVEEETDKAGLHASISGLDVLLDNGLHIHVSPTFVLVVSDHELRRWAGWGGYTLVWVLQRVLVGSGDSPIPWQNITAFLLLSLL